MGQILGAFDSAYGRVQESFTYQSTFVTNKVYIATTARRIVVIQGVVVTAGNDAGAVSISFYKCADGVAAASGTLLHSGSYNLKGTADVRQVLTLSTTPGLLDLNAGDAVAAVLTGTPTVAVGMFAVVTEPRQ